MVQDVTKCLEFVDLFLGRLFDRVDLISWSQLSVHMYLRVSDHPQKVSSISEKFGM